MTGSHASRIPASFRAAVYAGLFACGFLCGAQAGSVGTPVPVATTTTATETNASVFSGDRSALGISANPGAISRNTGNGDAGKFLQKLLGVKDDHGVFLGGLWVGDMNYLISGGEQPRSWTFNSLVIASLGLDAEKLVGWKGAKFGVEFLQFDGQSTNKQAGSAQGYNAILGPQPLNRSELYQLWYRQSLFDDHVIFRIGKMVPTVEFDNVMRPVPTQDTSLDIPAVTGLAFTPVFVNPAMLGAMPSYYNSSAGAVVTLAPTKNFYFSYGCYDGNVAAGVQTGMEGPHFNGYYFNIWEVGAAWEIDAGDGGKLPGAAAVGLWHQSGLLHGPGVTEDGMGGIYLFGSQRLWLEHPGKDNSGISAFAQFGANNSVTLPFNQYFGAGLTAFGLVPARPDDSAGVGVALSWLNPREFHRSSELMFQGYYQAHLYGGAYLQPVISYIPTPGLGADLGGAWAATLRMTVLF